MGLKHTDEFRQDAVGIALSSGLTRKQVGTLRQIEVAIFQYINGFYNPRRRPS